jgi:N-formylglutamate amidohydrolase
MSMDPEMQAAWDAWADTKIEAAWRHHMDVVGDALGETMQKFDAKIAIRCHSLIHALQQTQDVNVLIDLQLQPNRCTSATSDMAQGRHAKSQAVDRKIPATLSRAPTR